MNWQDTEQEPVKTEDEALNPTKVLPDDFLEETKQPD